MPTTLWNLPVPSTALLGAGLTREASRSRGRDQLAHETDEGSREIVVVFEGVEAFKSTYYRAGDASMLRRMIVSWIDAARLAR